MTDDGTTTAADHAPPARLPYWARAARVSFFGAIALYLVGDTAAVIWPGSPLLFASFLMLTLVGFGLGAVGVIGGIIHRRATIITEATLGAISSAIMFIWMAFAIARFG